MKSQGRARALVSTRLPGFSSLLGLLAGEVSRLVGWLVDSSAVWGWTERWELAAHCLGLVAVLGDAGTVLVLLEWQQGLKGIWGGCASAHG